MCQFVAGNGIFERGGECFLPHDGAKGGRPVFSRRNNKSIHDRIGQIVRHKCTKNIGFFISLRQIESKGISIQEEEFYILLTQPMKKFI
jgi:hypothetical protein